MTEASDVITQKTVDLKGMFCGHAVHTTKSRKVDLVFLQQLCGPEHPVEAPLSVFVPAVSIMQALRAIDGQAHEKVPRSRS